MNVRLLRKVARHISEEPKRFAMSAWIQRRSIPSNYVTDHEGHIHEFPSCNTAACIGGWALSLSGKRVIKDSWQTGERAAKLLNIDAHQADRLFSVDDWPEQFRRAYRRSKAEDARVRIAIERIEHFIKTKGAE